MKDFKDFMLLKTEGADTISRIKALLKQDIIIEGLKNFLDYMKANPTEGFVWEEDDEIFILKIANSKGLKFQKSDNLITLNDDNLPNNIVSLVDYNAKNNRILGFLEFIEVTMLNSKM